ncbi:VWA domain-containing protein [Arachidicoccus ginsenosidivorans]|uniref:VWA domain-containing protein n=1 Tax=Arachidicoccus ginsenosidivorans TaxID=496057 RepID=A0A5B8VLS4_9BACT|nr:VWA domain-containing protein [Arachidicoccus ginsenosidivorans]QEC72544.1 VWA domain-containing protein [Arachidicoccus ginsenosidivorans]
MIVNWLQQTDFAYPWLLCLLVLLPVLAYLHYRKQTQKSAPLALSTTREIKKSGTWKTRLIHIPFWLRILALGALIIAMARPRNSFTETTTDGQGIDMVLCFDISGSMTERDFIPNRLEAAKRVAEDFVRTREGDRIGVVIFSNISFTLTPVTTDYNMVLQQISQINSGYLEEEGTAIGSGLATSIDRLRYSKAKSKVIILLTDGMDFGGKISPDIATAMAKTYGIKVYTIGIGSNKTVDDNDPLGQQGTRQLDFNPTLLKNIARQTGGQYFQAGDNKTLAKVYESIGKLEKSDVKITTYNRYEEKYLPFVLAALLFLLLELVLRLSVLRKFP